MTIKYNQLIEGSSTFAGLKLLLSWRGSVWKLIYREILMFISVYFSIYMTYIFALNDNYRKVFQKMAAYCNMQSFLIPLNFVLGFYVGEVLSRFWMAFDQLPWTSSSAFYVNILITGTDEGTRKLRRTIMRYLCLSYTMAMRSISQLVKKRFPNFQNLISAGLITSEEFSRLSGMCIYGNNYFVPILWAISLVDQATKRRQIKTDIDREIIIRELIKFKSGCGKLIKNDWVNIPLAYTQTVSLAVYLFCFSCLLGRYPFIPETKEGHFPIFTIIQCSIYVAWLKVGESSLNPYGLDDDDFDGNFILDYTINESFTIVDHIKTTIPALVRDQHWDSVDFQLPGSSEFFTEYIGSAGHIRTMTEKMVLIDEN